MRIRLRYILCCALLSMCFSCMEKESRPSLVPTNGGAMIINESPMALKGELLIKIRSEENAQTKVAGNVAGGTAPSAEVVQVLSQNGKFKLERLFPECGRFEERTRAEGLHEWYITEFDKKISTSEIVSQLKNCSSVEVIEYSLPMITMDNGRSYPFNEPEDARLLQWHYHNDGAVFGTPSLSGADAGVWNAWEKSCGNPDVIVAVIDQGVKCDHEDLADNMWINRGEIPGNGKDDDGNGYIDDIHGYNFVDDMGQITASYERSHGTHVAGIIAAVNNNGIGVNGVAGGTGKGDGVRIMSLQTLGASESGSSGSGLGGAVRAMKYAADNGAVICQNSWGYPQKMSWNAWTRSSFSALRRAMDYFIKYAGIDENGNQSGPMKGGIILFASGNEAVDYLSFPGADEKVVCVSAFGYDGNAAYYTNYGSYVDVAAPGGNMYYDEAHGGIYSTSVGEDGSSAYEYMQGTSMACPHVSGACALAVSYYYGAEKRKGLTADALRSALLSSVRPINRYLTSQYVDKMGVGMLDAGRLLDYMDYVGDIPAQSVMIGKSLSIDLSEYFPTIKVMTYSVNDESVIKVELSRGVLVVNALKTGQAEIHVSDGNSLSKTIRINVVS